MATQKGLLYVAHLPFGFYDSALRGYFRQFGKIRKVRCERSKKTGRYKGYAFIEFMNDEVAKIAAEATDNYVLNRKVLKAKYIPADELKNGLLKRKRVYPTQRRTVKKTNVCSMVGVSKRSLVKRQTNYLKLHEKLMEYGVTNYDILPINIENLEQRIKESAGRKKRIKQLRKTAKEQLNKRKLEENVVTRILRKRKQSTYKRRLLLHAKKMKKVAEKQATVVKPAKPPLPPMAKKIDTFERALDYLRESVNKSSKNETVETEKLDNEKMDKNQSLNTNLKGNDKPSASAKPKRKLRANVSEAEKCTSEPKSKKKAVNPKSRESVEQVSPIAVCSSEKTEHSSKTSSGKDRLKSFRHKAQNMHYKYIS